MESWAQENADKANIIDHLTDFRLGIADDQYQDGATDIWWSVLIELSDTSIDQFADEANDHKKDLLIPVAYDVTDRGKEPKRQPVAIYARKPLIEALNKVDNSCGVVSVHLGAITPEEHLDFGATSPKLTEIKVKNDAVVMAVIDHGIAISHDCLRKGQLSSRIEHATILDAIPKGRGHSSVGRALDRDKIDLYLRKFTSNDLLDEDAFYQHTGIVNWRAKTLSPVARRVSHGTHVAGLAAGCPMDDASDTRPVICVSLPNHAVEDTTGHGSLPTICLAFHILVKQAQRFCAKDGRPAPVVFNFSFGGSDGPHDGNGLFERLFEYYFAKDRVTDTPGQKVWLTLPAGNLNLNRLHGIVDRGESTQFELSVLPDDRTPSNIEIWLPVGSGEHARPSIKVRVTAPNGLCATIPAIPGVSVPLRDKSNAEIARLACQQASTDKDSGNRVLVRLMIKSTAGIDGQSTHAPFGDWKLDVMHDQNATHHDIDLWIARGETLPGMRLGGRQAWFSNDDYKRFDRFGVPLATDPDGTNCPVRRKDTLSGFACGESPIVVAGFTERDADISLYSGSGPLPKGAPRKGPDLTAKADDSRVRGGVINAGSRSGSWVRISGTSMSSPRVARAAAEDIRGWDGSAREWCKQAVLDRPFPLKDVRENSSDRAGKGAIKIPVETWQSRVAEKRGNSDT